MAVKINYKIIFLLLIVLALIPWQKTFAGSLQKPANNLGLVGYWSFNEGTSTQAGDFSGHGNTGTLTTMSDPPTSTSGWGNGKLNGGLAFDGGSDYVVTSLPTTATTDVSMGAWFRTTDYTADRQVIVFNGSGGSDGYGVTINQESQSTGEIKILYGGVAWYSSGSTITDSNWHHIFLNIMSDGHPVLYLDGVQIYSGGVNTRNTPTSDFRIGNDNSGTGTPFFNGNIDEVRIYSRTLLDTEVYNLYQSGSAKINANTNNFLTNGLIGLWSFNGGDMTSTVAYDRSGNGDNGTLTAGPLKTIGKLGQALYFDGVDDDFNATGLAVDTTAGAWNTVSFWMYWTGDTDAGNGRAAFQFGFETTTYGLWHKVASSCFGFNTFNGDCWGVNPSGFENRWVHVVALFYNGATSNSRLFIDGVEQVLSGSSNTRTVENYISIGTANPTYEWQGKIDDVRIYSRALSTSEIKQLYLMGGGKINSSQNVLSGTLSSSLIGMWSFNGADFTDKVYDRSGSGYNGYVYNTATSTIKTIGKVGQAISIDGSSDFIAIPPLNISSNTVTFTSWIYSNAAQDGYTGLVYMRDPTQATGLGYSSSGANLGYTWSDNNFTYDWNSGLAIPNGEWVFAVIAVESTKATAYLCRKSTGCSSAVNTLTHVSVTFDTRLLIGADEASAVRYFNGKMDEVRIYNRTLSSSEVTRLYLTSGP